MFALFYPQAGRGRGRTLVKTLDIYGLGVAATLSGSTKSKTVETKNLVLRIDRVKQGSPVWASLIIYLIWCDMYDGACNRYKGVYIFHI